MEDETLENSRWFVARIYRGTPAAGVYPTNETMAAAQLLRRELPNLRVRVVNVTDLLILQPDSFHPHGLTAKAFEGLFTADKPVNFHGYLARSKNCSLIAPR